MDFQLLFYTDQNTKPGRRMYGGRPQVKSIENHLEELVRIDKSKTSILDLRKARPASVYTFLTGIALIITCGGI
jgi:hypothetical protein